MKRILDFSEVDFHKPLSWHGSALDGMDKSWFERMSRAISQLCKMRRNEVLLPYIMGIVDDVNFYLLDSNLNLQKEDSINELVSYMRVLLLSSEPSQIERIAWLADHLVKNAKSPQMYSAIGDIKFLKTLSKVARRLLSAPSDTQGFEKHRVGRSLLDIIQGWGEAFNAIIEYRELYPHFHPTYSKLLGKHQLGLLFPRPPEDPTRVPIFLIDRVALPRFGPSRGVYDPVVTRRPRGASPPERKDAGERLSRQASVGKDYSLRGSSESMSEPKSPLSPPDMLSFSTLPSAPPPPVPATPPPPFWHSATASRHPQTQPVHPSAPSVISSVATGTTISQRALAEQQIKYQEYLAGLLPTVSVPRMPPPPPPPPPSLPALAAREFQASLIESGERGIGYSAPARDRRVGVVAGAGKAGGQEQGQQGNLGDLVWKAFDDARKSTVQTQQPKVSPKPSSAHAEREINSIPPPPTSSPVSDNDGAFWKQQDSDSTDPTLDISMRFQSVNVGMRPVSTEAGNGSTPETETETEVESSSSSIDVDADGSRVPLVSKRSGTGVGFSQITDSSDHGVRIRYVGSQRIVTRVSTAAAAAVPLSITNSDESANALCQQQDS